MNEQKSRGIINKYSKEIEDIQFIIQNLENGKIKEKTGADTHGYLAHNAVKLKEKMNELLLKIDTDSPSINDELKGI